MEKLREIEVDLQNAIEEASRISTLFDYYLEERNEYHKTLEADMFAQRDKLQKELSALNKLNQQNLEKRQLFQNRLNKALKYIGEQFEATKKCLEYNKEQHNFSEVEKYTRDYNLYTKILEILEGNENE